MKNREKLAKFEGEIQIHITGQHDINEIVRILSEWGVAPKKIISENVYKTTLPFYQYSTSMGLYDNFRNDPEKLIISMDKFRQIVKTWNLIS